MHARTPINVAFVVSFLLAASFAFMNNLGYSQQNDDIQAIIADLQGLQFDEFIDLSYKQILLRHPETVTYNALSNELGIRDDQLDNICYAYVENTYVLKEGIREILETYDRSGLDYDQRISYDSYSWLLSDWAAEHEFMYHFYPVTHGISRQNDLFRLFEDVQPLETLEDVEDYIKRLTQVEDQFACLVQNLGDSEARGIMAPAQMLQQAADGIRGVIPGSAASLPFYTALEQKIGMIPGLSDVQMQDFLSQAIEAINSSVIPAYQALVTALDAQVPHAPAMNGVWQLPDGDEFYTAMLRHHTTTDMGPVEIHQKGLEEVARLRSELRDAFDALGYPANESYAQLFVRVAEDSGVIQAEEIAPYNESLIEQAQLDITEVFDIVPRTEVIVIGSASGGFYVPGSIDGSRPGAYYIGNQSDSYRYWMRTIAYHETVPGHHFQIALGNEQDVPLFSKGNDHFTAFVEGWALYAEYLAKELGWYDDDIYSELGRKQWELLRAVRMVVDTGLHYYRWSRQQAINYYIDAVGATVAQATGQIDLYLYLPGYFTTYKMGMMKILEYRQQAMDELGDRFDIKEFHRAVLLHNRLPLPLLERVIQDYIANPDQFSGKFVLNAGLNDAWYYPVTDGQGFFINVFPDLGKVTLSYFTYDTEMPPEDAVANVGDPGHRWFNAIGKYEGNQAVMRIRMATGGLFDTQTEIERYDDGTIILTFADCSTGTVEYDIPSIGRSGIIPIQRIVDDNIPLCESIAEQMTVQGESASKEVDGQHSPSSGNPDNKAENQVLEDMNPGLNDAWYYPVTDGQGFFVYVFPDMGKVSLSWFTYDTEYPPVDSVANLGDSGHRWLNALGHYQGNQAVMRINIASGGLFDTPAAEAEVTRIEDGTVILTFDSCNSGTVEYDIPSIGRSGSVPIQRIADDNIARCEAFVSFPSKVDR